MKSFIKALSVKLSGKSGASFAFALFLMLICLLLGTSILIAASAGAITTRNNRTHQQSYLSVSSCMELIEDSVEQLSFSATRVTEDYTCTEPEHTDTDTMTYSTTPDDLFARAVFDMAKEKTDGNKREITVTGENGILPVTVTLTMDSDYRLTATVCESVDKQYLMTAVFSPSVVPDTHTTESNCTHASVNYTITTTTVTETVHWSVTSVVKGDEP